MNSFHTVDGLTGIIVRDGKIFISSEDSFIRALDLATGATLQLFKGHEGSVNCILLRDNTLISASKDCSIKFWDIFVRQTHCLILFFFDCIVFIRLEIALKV